MIEIKGAIETLESNDLRWDFYEDGAVLEEVCEETVPGQLLRRVHAYGGSCAVGLSIAFAAKRGLACWFLYCSDVRPLETVNQTIERWVRPRIAVLPCLSTEIVQPTENGIRIVDCRQCDTSSASSAVAHAARFANDMKLLDAITSLSHAYEAFNCSPIGSARHFKSWLEDYAIPIAIEGRPMTTVEANAYADYSLPD
jgi:hypothetical protein